MNGTLEFSSCKSKAEYSFEGQSPRLCEARKLNGMVKKRDAVPQVLKFPSPQKLKKQISSGHMSKSTLNEKKANIQRFWYELVEECLVIEERKTHDNATAGDWWKKFANTPKQKQQNYGARVEVLKKIAKRLFKTEIFMKCCAF